MRTIVIAVKCSQSVENSQSARHRGCVLKSGFLFEIQSHGLRTITLRISNSSADPGGNERKDSAIATVEL
jgi:hypothetical protein